MKIRLIPFVGLILSALILTEGKAVSDDNCDEFIFSLKGSGLEGSKNLLNDIVSSLRKIYWDQTGTEYKGTATLIDFKNRLFLTAMHVTRKDLPIYLEFPPLRDKKLWPAKYVDGLPQADGGEEVKGSSWDEARDIALVQLDDPLPADLKSAEIWLDNIYLTEVVSGIWTGCSATIDDQRRVMDYESNPQESPCQF